MNATKETKVVERTITEEKEVIIIEMTREEALSLRRDLADIGYKYCFPLRAALNSVGMNYRVSRLVG